MAKGVEDTAFYCFNRMIGLNEVGASPDRNGVSLGEFHAFCDRTHMLSPQAMNTLSTHDTKRSDDVRARLAVLTEVPGAWRAALRRWSRMNRLFKIGEFPDRNTEYFLYQTLIGAWPIAKERTIAYMEKAVREAKEQTSWTQQNKEFEDALREFIEPSIRFRAVYCGPGRVCFADSSRRKDQQPDADPHQMHGARCARQLSGQRDLGSSP